MRDPVLVFIDLLRLYHLNKDAFNWVVEILEISFMDGTNDEEEAEKIAGLLLSDIMMYGKRFVLRESSGDVQIWDPESSEWNPEDTALVELVKQYPKNPLRT